MIKAEVITHEGNPGPNWLDHCKTMVAPWMASLVILALAILLTVVTLQHRHQVGQANQLPASATSQPAPHLTALDVLPLASSSAVQPTASNVQAAGGAGSSAAAATTQAATVLGAKNTPNLNSASNAVDSTRASTTADPNNVTSKQLTPVVQSIVTPAQNTVNDTLSKLHL